MTTRDIKVRTAERTYSYSDWDKAIAYAQAQPDMVHVEQASQHRSITFTDGVGSNHKGDIETVAVKEAVVRAAPVRLGVDERTMRRAGGEIFIVKQGRHVAGVFLLPCCAAKIALRCHGRINTAYQPEVAQRLRMDIDNGGCLCATVTRTEPTKREACA